MITNSRTKHLGRDEIYLWLAFEERNNALQYNKVDGAVEASQTKCLLKMGT